MTSDYEVALIVFQQHVRLTDEGFYRLEVEDGQAIGIADPRIFDDLRRRLDETNYRSARCYFDPSPARAFWP